MRTDNFYYLRSAPDGLYLDLHYRWYGYADYGMRCDSLESVRHNIRLCQDLPEPITPPIAGCSDAYGRWFPLRELFR